MLHRNQSKRLDHLEAKTRAQWEAARVEYWNELLSLMPVTERQAAQDCIVKWYTSPDEYKTDEFAIRQYFTAGEIEILRRVDMLSDCPRFALQREAISALYDALQACERVRA